LTDPDPNILKSAAAYLVQVARTTKGGRYRKSAKIEALRECKDEILEAHRSGISIHRIAQIFRERNVDISTQHLMRAIRLFIKEGEGTKGKTSVAEATGTSEKTAQKPVTNRFLNRLLLLFGRRSLRSNCGSRGTWPGRASDRRALWKKRARQAESSLSRGPEPRHNPRTKRV
jgi:hypothetical protein